MTDVILYSTGCPKCKVLKKKLENKGVEYTENNSVDQMLSMGIKQAPMLSVDGQLMNYIDAIHWVNNI